ncbi:MAG TPA: hypothetical protein VNS57_16465 [Steroidobacteraceae bacterium]|nr:hypothetical protein [Steroidobacteraceae bacterium]
MSVRKRLQRWWDELLGRPRWYRDPGGSTTKSGLQPVRPQPQSTAGLSLAEDAPSSKTRGRSAARRSAGMDPYANDAGYAKPHSWERIDHD